MILVTEKSKILATGKKEKNKTAFRDLSAALRYVVDWTAIHRYDIGVEVWKKEVKFGFYTVLDNGDEYEIIVEEILCYDDP